MRTYKLTIAYDGTRYQGWQRQANTDRTIQGILEKTIGDMLKNCGGLREGKMVPEGRMPEFMPGGRRQALCCPDLRRKDFSRKR